MSELQTIEKSFEEALKRLEASPTRRFKQTYEIIINLEGIDVKRDAEKLSGILKLPHPIQGLNNKVCVIAEREIASEAQKAGADLILRRTDLEKLQGNKRELKKIARNYKYFLAQPDLMPLVGKLLGAYLGSRGKLPQVIAPNVAVDKIINDLKQSIRLRIKGQPVISCAFGKEGMDLKSLKENAFTIIEEINKRIAGKGRITSIYIKKTMSEPVRIK
ncbi:MAG: 50S ribosomal protein L1 [Thermoproteota archaeon]|jgi:large subunit ribosomal protein L1|nr:50S ribosomal protein L1 [Thermoproteota archaeon]